MMVNGINSTIESLRGIVTELKEAGINIGSVSQNLLSSGQEMNSMVTQLSGSVEQIADGAKTQAQQIVEASRESEGVGKTASNTLNQSEDMNKVAEVANKAAKDSSKAMAEAMRVTDLMLEGSRESVSSIESLSKSNEQIQEIVDVIRDIATQTNILAINAAIETVRGQAGQGLCRRCRGSQETLGRQQVSGQKDFHPRAVCSERDCRYRHHNQDHGGKCQTGQKHY